MKTSRALRGMLRLLLVGAVTVMLTGCAEVLPRPTAAYGAKLTQKQVAFIHPGKTTRAEVVTTLGTNCVTMRADVTSACPAALAYTWEGGLDWHLRLVLPGLQSSTSHGGWYAFMVALSPTDVVIAADFKTLNNQRSLDEQISAWAIKQQGKN